MPSTTTPITLTPEARARWVRLIAERIVDEYLAEIETRKPPAKGNEPRSRAAQSGVPGPRPVR